MKKQYGVRIKFGQEDGLKKTVMFKTSEERRAYLLGLEHSNGWFDYEVKKLIDPSLTKNFAVIADSNGNNDQKTSDYADAVVQNEKD